MSRSVERAHVGHLPAIDGLRAVSIVAVLAFHFSLGLRGGFLGVDLFFAISGFVITRGLLVGAASDTPTVDLLKAFYRRRVWRLWPALFVLLLAVLGVGFILKPTFWEEPSVTLRNAIAAAFAGGNWFQVVVADPPDGAFRPLIHMWSLSIEEQFYVVLPVLVLVGRRFARRAAGSVALVALGAPVVAALFSPSARWSFFATPARVGPIGAGVVVALLLSNRRVAQHGRSTSRTLLAPVAFACMASFGLLTLTASWEQQWLWRGGYAVLPILYGMLVWTTAQLQESWWGRVLSLPPVLWLGSRSYSLYLVHFPLVGWLERSGEPAPRFERVGLLLLSLLLAEVSFRWIESPLRTRGTRRSKPETRSEPQHGLDPSDSPVRHSIEPA
jgi:peptidoglycan/LPS O-acetylase OafA/YrhL